MTTHKPRLRQLHRIVAPIMILPVLLTLITGSLYQLVDIGGKGDAFQWLLNIHKGHFGIVNLEIIYPFLNALGLLTLAITGILMWLEMQRTTRKRYGRN